jgi:hypothetical protein
VRAEILDRAHDILRDRASTGGWRAVEQAVRRLSRYFDDRADLTDLLDCHVQASLIAQGSRTGDLGRLRGLLARIAQAAQSPAGAATAAIEAAGLQRALIEWGAIDGDVAITMLTELPGSVSIEPAISSRAAEELATLSEKPSRKLLDLLARLDEQGKAPSSGALAGLLEADKGVRGFIRRAHEERSRTDVKYLEGTLMLLHRAPSVVIAARLDEVLTACLEARNPYLGAHVLTLLKSPLPRLLVERWGRTLGTRDLVSDGLWCVRCLDYDDLPGRREEQLTAIVRDFAGTLPKERLDTWRDEVARQVEPEKRDLWERIFLQEAPRSRISLWRNRDGGRS